MTAVTVQERQHPIVALFTSDDAQKYIAPFLPEGMDPTRVAASVLLAVKLDKTKKLGKCTPQSLVLGVAKILQWRLELGVTAHLIPFKDEAVPVADYKGLCELMIASGAVRYVEARAVYKGDQFTYKLGLEPMLEHYPTGTKTNRGPITHAYVIVHLPYGRKAFDVMNAEDIDAIRQQYSKQWKDGPLPAWYAKKTVVRQTAKLLPKNPALAQFFAVLEQDRTHEIEQDPAPALAKVTSLVDEDEITPPATDEDDLDDSDLDDREFTPPY